MDGKMELIIGIILLAIAIILYLISQISTTLESLGNNLLLILASTIFAIIAIFFIFRAIKKLA